MGALRKFIDSEASSGLFLFLAAVAAVIIDNSPLAALYDQTLTTNIVVQIGDLGLDKPILLWINDGLMAIFFLLVGLEIKREFLTGELSSKDQITLPALAAFGGMAVPAAIYAAINWGDADLIRGWAIPTATDIAFALGVLALLGKRVPLALKVFLMTIAILDDIGAILIIALVYTGSFSLLYLGLGAAVMGCLWALNRGGATRLSLYILFGIALWFFVLKSGVHATIAGVLLALFIPMRGNKGPSPLVSLEDGLHPYVAWAIMPLFAFVNAGVSFKGFSFETLLGGLPLGIFLGLVVGKQLGVSGMTWLALKLKWARLPKGVSLRQVLGVGFLAGIGFTMSLFIGMLAFEDPAYAPGIRFGVLLASLVAGTAGYLTLRLGTKKGKA